MAAITSRLLMNKAYRGPILESDAAINPGSDGGPLTGANGNFIGLISLAWTQSRDSSLHSADHILKHTKSLQNITIEKKKPQSPFHIALQKILAQTETAVVTIRPPISKARASSRTAQAILSST